MYARPRSLGGGQSCNHISAMTPPIFVGNYRILPVRLPEQTRQCAGSLMRPQKGDDDLPTITALLTAQFLADVSDRKIVAQVRAQFCQ
jgi:hypothetical protein